MYVDLDLFIQMRYKYITEWKKQMWPTIYLFLIIIFIYIVLNNNNYYWVLFIFMFSFRPSTIPQNHILSFFPLFTIIVLYCSRVVMIVIIIIIITSCLHLLIVHNIQTLKHACTMNDDITKIQTSHHCYRDYNNV